VDYKTASEHWVHVGLTQGASLPPVLSICSGVFVYASVLIVCGMPGLRSSPTFDVKVYLAKNRDLERTFGPNNYPFAVLHYLARGHLV